MDAVDVGSDEDWVSVLVNVRRDEAGDRQQCAIMRLSIDVNVERGACAIVNAGNMMPFTKRQADI